MFWLWMIMAMVLQRPLVAGLIVVGLWLALDRAWFARIGFNKWLARRRLEPKLRSKLAVNPHDRDARFELAEVLVGRGGHDEALRLIEQNIQAGDGDSETLYVAGVAAFGASSEGDIDKAEGYLARARDKSPSFRSGAVEMALGRGRLIRARFEAAQTALRAAIAAQPGSVEAHVLLARALAGQGKTDEANEVKARAWQLYTEAPRFKRRQVRPWAWRANPMAAVRYFSAVVAVVAVVVAVVARLVPSLPDGGLSGEWSYVVDGFNVDLSGPPPASRFEIAMGDAPDPSDSLLARWDLDQNGTTDIERKLLIGDLWCRLRTHYPELPPTPPPQLEVVDSVTGQQFGVQPLQRAYEATHADRETIHAFEALLEATPPNDCSASVVINGIRIDFGVRNGVAFDDVR